MLRKCSVNIDVFNTADILQLAKKKHKNHFIHIGVLAVWSPVHGTAYVNLRKATTQVVATKQNTS
jgi:glycerol-3-phosphate responsive antiterminator